MASGNTRPTIAASPEIAVLDVTPPRSAAVTAVADESAPARNAGNDLGRGPSTTCACTVTEANAVGVLERPTGQKSQDSPSSAVWLHSSSTPHGHYGSSSKSSSTGDDSGSVLLAFATATESCSIPSTEMSYDMESSANNNRKSNMVESSSSSSSSGAQSSNGNNSSSGSSSTSSGNTTNSGSGKPGRYGVPPGDESMNSLRRHVELLVDREVNTRTRSRLEACLDALEPQIVDLHLLRVVCAKGLPEGCAALRSIYWRLLLNCLPPNPADWQQRRCKLREAYESYKAEFIREPEAVRRLRRMQQQQRQDGEDGTGEAKWNKPFPATAAAAFGEGYTTAPCDSRLPGCEVSTDGGGRLQSDSSIPLAAVKDHPLCRSATSEWRGYWVDAEVFDQINKDVFRTRPELCFFALNPQQTIARQQQLHLYPPPPTRHTQSQQQQQNEHVPRLVNYDLILQHQQQPQQQLQHQQPPTRAAPNPAEEGTCASNKHKAGGGSHSRSFNSTSSPLRGFRLPSAFRSKKKLVSATVPANPDESVCNSGSGGSGGRGTCSGSGGSGRSSSSLHAGVGGRCSSPQQNAKERAVPGGGGQTRICSSSSPERVLPGCVRSRNRQSPDAADPMKVSAATEQDDHLLKRQMGAAKSRAERRNASVNSNCSNDSSNSGGRSCLDPRLPSGKSCEPEPVRGPGKAEQLPQNLPANFGAAAASAVATDAEAAPAAWAPGEETDFRDQSGCLEDCAAVAAVAPDGGNCSVATEQLGGAEAVQPWRAPAGVQDVCNMITPHRHYDVLSRLLFIYAKVNAGLCYVQGMNEILAPIYYALMTDPTYTDYEQAEAEIFYCFSEVMQQQRDAFCKALDPTDAGVRGRLSSLDGLLRQKDEEVWMHLNAVGVEPQFYALRWLLLMLTQEFEMPDVLALWDGLIADTGRPLPLLYYVCVAIIIWLRPALLAGDFTACMKLLQHLPSFDPKALLSCAMRLRADDVDGNLSPARPVPVGGRRRREGLEELDPLQQVSDSLFKPISRAIAALSLNDGQGAVPNEAVRLGGGVAEAVGERNWTKGIFLSPSLLGEGSVHRGEGGDGEDAPLGHLKRLAGAGVEHACRGASVVSQYLNNSGLASGLASNITSFFGGESTSSSAVSPPEATETSAADERPRQSAAAKFGEFLAAAQNGLSSGITGATSSRMGQEKAPETSPAPDTDDTLGRAPQLIECPFSPVEEAVSEALERLPLEEDSTLRDISPRQRKLWDTDSTEGLGGIIGDADSITDSPRGDSDKRSFKSPEGEGLRITIL